MTLKALCLKVRCDATMTGAPPPEGFVEGSSSWKVKLRYRGRRLTVPFYTGPLAGEPRDAESVLECLLSDAQAGEQDFEDFCSDFGYDSDSRRAEKIWRACRKIAPRLRQFLGDEYDAFMDADR